MKPINFLRKVWKGYLKMTAENHALRITGNCYIAPEEMEKR